MAKKSSRFTPDRTHLGLTAAASLLGGMLFGIHLQPAPPEPVPVIVELGTPVIELPEPATVPDRVVDEPYPTFDFGDDHIDADPNRETTNTGARIIGGGS